MITLYRGIVKGRQRQLKTEGTGIWFSTSLNVAKTYSDTVEVWQLDDTLPLQAVQINCNGKSWNEVNTDTLARKYANKDVVLFKDVVDVGSNWLDQLPDEAKSSKEPVHSVLKKYFTANDWVVNNDNCINRLRIINFKENKQMNNLYEQIFQEASKRRFIEPLWQKLNNHEASIMNMTQHQDEALPNIESIIKWVDSGAADKCHIDWQKLKSDEQCIDEVVRIINSFYDYYNKGGSIKDKKALARDDIKQVFRGHRVTFDETGNGNGHDMALLCENDKFVFVVPITQIGAEWMNSFECGGEGARWCIGTADDDSYWRSYIDEGVWFILAMSKRPFLTDPKKRKEDTLKYMIELSPESDGPKAWKQSDDPDNTIPGGEFNHVFGISPIELGEIFAQKIMTGNNDYSNAGSFMYRPTTGEFIRPWGEWQITTDKYFFSDLASGVYTHHEIEQNISHHDSFIIDCEGEEFKPEKAFRWALVAHPENIYGTDKNDKILDLDKFIRGFNDGDFTRLAIMNGKIDKIYITGITNVDVYFENCEINTIYYYQHSHDNGLLRFVDGTEIEDIFWDSDEEFFTCNIDSVTFEKEPYYEYFLLQEGEEIDE